MSNLSLYDATDDSNVTEYDEDQVNWFKLECIFWFEGLLVPIVGSIGLLGNILSILVLYRCDLDLKASFVNLLITLCIFDILFIVAVIMFYTLPIHFEYYEIELLPYLTPFLLPFIHIALTGSVYAVVAVAVERYFMICNPFNTNYHGRGMRYVAFIVIFSLVYNINKFLEVTYEYEVSPTSIWNETSQTVETVNVTKAVVAITSLREDPTYTQVAIVVNFVVMVVMPLMILSICHVLTFRSIRENTQRHNAISSHQRRDNAMAMLFFIIIACFVLSHSGKFVLNFFEISRLLMDRQKDEWPLWAFVLTRINHLLLVVNSSINFFIYCFRDAKFSDALLSLLGVSSQRFSRLGRNRGSIMNNNNNNNNNSNSRGGRTGGPRSSQPTHPVEDEEMTLTTRIDQNGNPSSTASGGTGISVSSGGVGVSVSGGNCV